MSSLRTSPAHEYGDEEPILSYAETIAYLLLKNRTKTKGAIAKIIPFPTKPVKNEPYATVEVDFEGDFGDDKDPHTNVLRMLELL